LKVSPDEVQSTSTTLKKDGIKAFDKGEYRKSFQIFNEIGEDNLDGVALFRLGYILENEKGIFPQDDNEKENDHDNDVKNNEDNQQQKSLYYYKKAKELVCKISCENYYYVSRLFLYHIV
jgi:hypothetical protein